MPFNGVYICADGDPMGGVEWVVGYWSVILLTESTFLCLVLYKAWKWYKTGAGGSLMGTVIRDSVIYFVL